ncbi:L-lactate permease (plasmid) [Rubrobacter radiotolerans]|uniref:L-lactate permease n=1 Tax=Rubrobacter radiotolerans TaxID=42256 RepID=A0A023X8G6_RUBRA|nr:L-lactate permease [Rubrobacter radiotolerans]AHY48335.1 L-lactate permease [Rubrobacter radiotolerans]MDX5895472.1 L-lactate permease [Rubrobacter radiotolerans]SMC01533.1 lactate permease [Rubrobacter radiotolerans DSM 5868]
MEATDLPVNLLYWSLAAAPIIILLVLLVGLRWSATEAAPVGMFVAAAIALIAFESPWETVAVAGGKGIWDAIFILLVVWPALLLYRVGERAGAFNALREGIEKFSRNELFLVLAFGWVFASFLQGIAGFGVPIAVVAPLLLALGVRPIYAVGIPLIGHAWANMFGTLAVGWLATLQVVDLENPVETAFQNAIMLWVPAILAGFTIAWMYGKMPAIRNAWPMILIIAGVQGGLQLVLMLWDPILSTFLAASAALLLLYPLSLWSRYDQPDERITERPAMQEDDEEESEEAEEEREEAEEEPEPVMGLWMSLMPYAVLTVVTVVALAIPPIEEALETVEFGIPFPGTETGLGVENEAEDDFSPIAPLTHPGTFLLIGAAVGYVTYRSRGYYRRWEERAETEGIFSGLVGNATPASIAIVAFLITSALLDETGQIEVLAAGIAEVSPPVVFAFLANFIGVLGAFMTSSNTSSNILFAPLQQTVAGAEGLSEATIIAAQSTGGAVGNAIAPANVALGTGTVGASGKEGDVLRLTIPWAVATAVITGGLSILMLGITFL